MATRFTFLQAVVVSVFFAAAGSAENQAGLPSSEKASVASIEANGTESHPQDNRYLNDQIDLKLRFDAGPEFVIATRPGENIYITKPFGKMAEKRFTLVVMPIPFGLRRPVPRDELRLLEANQVGFSVVPFCLNSAASTGKPDLGTADSCTLRDPDETGGDFVLPLTGLAKRDLAVGEDLRESATGATLAILAYRESGHKGFQQVNPYSKCCRISQGIEVCACSVVSATQSCNAGCPVSKEMLSELGLGQ